jgi:hypothetical protein
MPCTGWSATPPLSVTTKMMAMTFAQAPHRSARASYVLLVQIGFVFQNVTFLRSKN